MPTLENRHHLGFRVFTLPAVPNFALKRFEVRLEKATINDPMGETSTPLSGRLLFCGAIGGGWGALEQASFFTFHAGYRNMRPSGDAGH